MLLASIALVALLLGCGGDSSSDSGERAGPYSAEVVRAQFPAKQRLGETTLMRIGVRNEGEETIPALSIAVTVGGRDGEASSLPFGVRDPQPGLAEPDRPVWVLAEHYPRLAGSGETAGAETSTTKVFTFGPLKRGRVTEAVWKLTASRTGRYQVRYAIDAGADGGARVEGHSGSQPGGSFRVTISEEPVDTTVTDDGRVVEIGGSNGRDG